MTAPPEIVTAHVDATVRVVSAAMNTVAEDAMVQGATRTKGASQVSAPAMRMAPAPLMWVSWEIVMTAPSSIMKVAPSATSICPQMVPVEEAERIKVLPAVTVMPEVIATDAENVTWDSAGMRTEEQDTAVLTTVTPEKVCWGIDTVPVTTAEGETVKGVPSTTVTATAGATVTTAVSWIWQGVAMDRGESQFNVPATTRDPAPMKEAGAAMQSQVLRTAPCCTVTTAASATANVPPMVAAQLGARMREALGDTLHPCSSWTVFPKDRDEPDWIVRTEGDLHAELTTATPVPCALIEPATNKRPAPWTKQPPFRFRKNPVEMDTVISREIETTAVEWRVRPQENVVGALWNREPRTMN